MRKKILVLDDSKVMRDLIIAALQNEDCEIFEAENPLVAFKLVEDNAFDLIMSDLNMPGMTGLDVANATKGRCQVVFTTAYDNHA